MAMKRDAFGKTSDGRAVELFTLSSGNVMLTITNFGGHITQWHVPDRTGKSGNVVLGYETVDHYLVPNPYFGATIGRFANRIAKGHFALDGKEYNLPKNNGPNTLHGGPGGFDKVLWQAEPNGDLSLRLTYLSPDGEEGFPGTVHASATFTLGDDGALTIEYEATTDKATPVNFTNHTYFNLSGPGSGDILAHELTLHADAYTPVDATLIPTGEIVPVGGTPMDFTKPMPIGSRIAKLKGGYDHNFALNSKDGTLASAAQAFDAKSGRVLEILTTQPGVQFYSGNFLSWKESGIGGRYEKHGGFCLETQHFPDSPNRPSFPNAILRPGETYRQSAVYRFSTR